MDATETSMDVAAASDETEAVLSAIEASIIADREFLESVLIGVLSRGHVLLEDVPGTGKTLTARNVAHALGLSFSRVQFTPDLLPADITGTHMYNEGERAFEFNEGPVFANVVLADEINRAPPKTQAALLEAMGEGQVTVDGERHDLPDPFFVLATQNPVEMAGTFELPEAQMDRFAVKTAIGYPDEEGENELLRRRIDRQRQTPRVEGVLESEEVRAMQAVPETVRVEEDLISYMTAIARATREHPSVAVGVSPRGTQRLLETSRARAVIEGREFLAPEDIKRVVVPVLAHRLVLTPDASVEDVEKASVLRRVLDDVPVPTV